MKPSWLGRDIFAAPFSYTLVTSEDELHVALRYVGCHPKYWPFWLNEGSDATTHFVPQGQCSKAKQPIAIVCVRVDETRSGIVAAGLLVHEAVHLFQMSCEYVGEHSPSKEFEAYSIQWLSQQLMWEYERRLST